jgi:hypothetical protein
MTVHYFGKICLRMPCFRSESSWGYRGDCAELAELAEETAVRSYSPEKTCMDPISD